MNQIMNMLREMSVGEPSESDHEERLVEKLLE